MVDVGPRVGRVIGFAPIAASPFAYFMFPMFERRKMARNVREPPDHRMGNALVAQNETSGLTWVHAPVLDKRYTLGADKKVVGIGI